MASFATCGATIPLCIAGAALSVIGGGAVTGALITEYVTWRYSLRDIQTAVNRDIRSSERLGTSLDELKEALHRDAFSDLQKILRIVELNSVHEPEKETRDGDASLGCRAWKRCFLGSASCLPPDLHTLVISSVALAKGSTFHAAQNIRDLLQSLGDVPQTNDIPRLMEAYIRDMQSAAVQMQSPSIRE